MSFLGGHFFRRTKSAIKFPLVSVVLIIFVAEQFLFAQASPTVRPGVLVKLMGQSFAEQCRWLVCDLGRFLLRVEVLAIGVGLVQFFCMHGVLMLRKLV